MPFKIKFHKDLTLNIRDCPHLLIIGNGDNHSEFAKRIGQMVNCDDELWFAFEDFDAELCNGKQFDSINWVGGVVSVDLGDYKLWADKIDQRYEILHALSCDNIEQYNERFYHNKDRYFFVLTKLEQPLAEQNVNYLQQILMKGRAVGVHIIMFADKVAEFGDNTDLLDMFPVKLVYKVKNKKESTLLTGCAGAEKLKDNEFMLCEIGKRPVIYKY